MTYYIIDKKANNFSKTSSFAINIAVAVYDSLYVYILSVLSASLMICLLSMPSPLRLRLLYLNYLLCLHFLWLALSTSTIYALFMLFMFLVSSFLW